MTGSLVVEPTDGAEPWSSLEGGGVASSWADVGSAVGAGDPFQAAFALAAAGLDTLGAVADPFDAVVGSAVGYAIEHVAFLREPLDALAGDPRRITAHAQSWHNAGTELRDVAAGCRQAGAASSEWQGAAGDAHRHALTDHAQRLDAVAGRSEQLAGLLVGTGAAVGTVRALVRDMIADFLAAAVERLLLTTLTAAVSGGVSALAGVGWLVWEAVQLADRIADRIAALLTTLSAAGGAAGRLADDMIDAAARAIDLASAVQHRARVLDEAFAAVPAAEVAEAGKQLTKAEPPGPAAPGQTGTLT